MEIHFNIGLKGEAEKYAKLLGYNYQSSEWYEQTYTIFNKDYAKKLRAKKYENRNFIIRKFRSFMDSLLN